MNRGSYYTLDSIAGWLLSKWQTYICFHFDKNTLGRAANSDQCYH